MNAEDTKERIRQLRERVVSDPNSIVPGQDFSPLTEQRLKSVKSWQSVKKEGNPENLSANDLTTKLSLQTPNEIKKEFDSRYKKNFEMNEDQTLTDNQSNKNNSYLLEEIDSRVLNNSREFIKFFDEKFQKIKDEIVLNKSFEIFKTQIEDRISKDSSDIVERLDDKIRTVEISLEGKSIKLTNNLSSEIEKIYKNVQNDFQKALEHTSQLKSILPEKVAEVEKNIYSEVTKKINAVKSEFLNLKDSLALRSEVMSSELGIQIDDLNQKINLKSQTDKQDSDELRLSLEDKIDSSIIIIQDQMVANLTNIEKQIGNLRDSFALRSEAMSSELSLQIDDLKGMVDLNAQKSEKTDESIKLLIDEKIKSKVTIVKTEVEDQLKGLEWEVGNLRDSFALRSEAMSSELSLQIDDLKLEVDLNAQKSKKTDESIQLSFDEKVESAVSSVKTDIDKKLNGFALELTSQKNSFNDRTKNISSELGVQIENLKLEVDLNVQKGVKENESIQLILNEKVESTVSSVKTDIDKKLNGFELELTSQKGSFEKKSEEISSLLGIQIQNLDKRINSDIEQNQTQYQALMNSLDSVEENFRSRMDQFDGYLKKLEQVMADNHVVIKNDFDESERRALGEAKEKYRTLKSIVWGQLDLVKKNYAILHEDIVKIENQMVTSDTLSSNLETERKKLHTLVEKYKKKELERLSDLIQGVEAKILSEKNITELFQNYTLNVNIGGKNSLLSDVKKEFEKKSLLGKILNKKKFSKMVAIVILLSSIIAYMKVLA